MAAVINDFVPDTSRFHHHNTMVTGSGRQQSPAEAYRQRSKSRPEPPTPSPRPQSTAAGTPSPRTHTRAFYQEKEEDVIEGRAPMKQEPLSPPSSSSPGPGSYTRSAFMSQQHFNEPAVRPVKKEEPDEPKLSSAPLSSVPPPDTKLSLDTSGSLLEEDSKHGSNTIKVRDLAHIQSFASEEFLSFRGQSGRRRTADDPALKYEISGMPIGDIIEMVAGLLTKITTTNDRQHENLHRPLPPQTDASNLSGLSSSVLAFHGKNVPSITILSYLSRIHKYCPTTYEVFLSLLVYFDRMTERVNATPMQALHREVGVDADPDSRPSTSYSASGSDLADDSPVERKDSPDIPIPMEVESTSSVHTPSRDIDMSGMPLSHFFVVDSFNIHRLVIAGVTCASKFFSDVFYTNSRYAKVGGLPLAELNHLELQFLLLNDFRLSVPVEELEAYGTMLVEFYAREVVSQRQNSGIAVDPMFPEEKVPGAA